MKKKKILFFAVLLIFGFTGVVQAQTLSQADFDAALDHIGLLADLTLYVDNAKRLERAMKAFPNPAGTFNSTVTVAGNTLTVLSALSSLIEIGNMSDELRRASPAQRADISARMFRTSASAIAPYLSKATLGGPATMWKNLGVAIVNGIRNIDSAIKMQEFEDRITKRYAEIRGVAPFKNTAYYNIGFKIYRNQCLGPRIIAEADAKAPFVFPPPTVEASIVELMASLQAFDKISGAKVTNDGAFTYTTLSSGFIRITGYNVPKDNFRLGIKGGTVPNPLTVPMVLYGREVQEIGENAFKNNTDITSVALPSTIKYISSGAFANCKSLIKVTIPASVKTINFGVDAFKGTNLDAASKKALTDRGYKF